MNNSLTLTQIGRLPVNDLLAAISEIWDSIVAEGVTLPVSAELDRRLAKHATDPSAAGEWCDGIHIHEGAAASRGRGRVQARAELV
jgi:putative addiction module component (TIGR02574 family)